MTAANATIMKNISPTISPAIPISLNTFGSDINISPGPADMPSRPINTYTAGIIIRPARNATSVSKISIWLIEPMSFDSFLTYEPYATMIPIATLIE